MDTARTGRRLLMALLCLLAAVALLAPSAAQSDPVSDRISAVLQRAPTPQMPPGLGGRPTGPVARGMPAFVCQTLSLVRPVAVTDLLRSLGVGPCMSA